VYVDEKEGIHKPPHEGSIVRAPSLDLVFIVVEIDEMKAKR